MIIHQYVSDILSSNMYLIEEGRHAIVIDPSRDIVPGQNKTIDYIIITHEHYDHISGVNLWKECYHAPLLCSRICAERITDPKKNQARHFDAFYEIQSWLQNGGQPQIETTFSCDADITFVGDMELQWKDHLFHMTELPGHSPGSIGILIDGIHFFSGDSMIKDTEVELRFPGGSKTQWDEISKPKIRLLQKGTYIWPGHLEPYIL